MAEKKAKKTTKKQEAPKQAAEKKPVTQPRVGVFICHCGTNIAGSLDIEEVQEYAKNLIVLFTPLFVPPPGGLWVRLPPNTRGMGTKIVPIPTQIVFICTRTNVVCLKVCGTYFYLYYPINYQLYLRHHDSTPFLIMLNKNLNNLCV